MRREKPIMNLLMISNAFSFPWIGTHLVKVPFLFSSLVVLAVCVRARIFLFLSRFRSRSCFDFGITLPFPISIQIETQELIGWIGFWLLPRNAFISPCFTIFECRTMNISPRVARRCFALVEEFENGREIKAERTNKKHLYIYKCVCAIGLRAAIVFMQCILHEQIVKWNGSQTYISQRYLSYSWAHAISRFYFLFCFWCFVLASPFSLLDARSAPHLHCLQRFHSIHQVPTIHFYKLQSLPYNHWSLGVLQKEKHTQTTTTNEIKKMNAFRIMEQKCKQIGTT